MPSIRPPIQERWCHLRIVCRKGAHSNWLAEVWNGDQLIPELTAAAESAGKAATKAEILTLRWIAGQIEAGHLDPLEFSLAIRAGRAPTPEQSYQEAVMILALAASNNLHSEYQRSAVLMSLLASQQFLMRMGFDGELLKPLGQLGIAIGGLDSGSVDPILRPAKLSKKPPDPPSAWVARAALAAALEVRVGFMREKLRHAVDWVIKDVRVLKIRITGGKRHSLPDSDRLIQLRKDFRSRRRVPLDGAPDFIWKRTVERAAAASNEEEPYRSELLRAAYSGAILAAAGYRSLG